MVDRSFLFINFRSICSLIGVDTFWDTLYIFSCFSSVNRILYTAEHGIERASRTEQVRARIRIAEKSLLGQFCAVLDHLTQKNQTV